MASIHHLVLVNRLKKKIKLLQHKNEKNRLKLHNTVKKLSQMGKIYRLKLAAKMLVMKAKVKQVKSSTYAKVAADLEKQMSKNLRSKTKRSRVVKVTSDKKSAAQLTKNSASKGKREKSRPKRRGTTVRVLRKNAKAKRRGGSTGLRRGRRQKY